MKRALVTGSAGFVGRHMRERLDDAGWDVTGWDIRSGIDAAEEFPFGPNFDLVVHAAAAGADRRSIDFTPLALAENLQLDAALFRYAATERFHGRVVYLSSAAAYPMVLQQHGAQHLLHETNINHRYPQAPDGIYGWIKLTGERLASLARQAGAHVTVVRPFSGYGEDQGTRFPFGALAERARKREDPFTVWGSGDQVRDFIHIEDICTAILAAVDLEYPGPVNLGTGRATSMRELITMFCMEAGFGPQKLEPTGGNEGAHYRVADVTLMRDLHVPAITLEESVKRMMSR
jgi:nucleoside-diphosphate-sugar epimerase